MKPRLLWPPSRRSLQRSLELGFLETCPRSQLRLRVSTGHFCYNDAGMSLRCAPARALAVPLAPQASSVLIRSVRFLFPLALALIWVLALHGSPQTKPAPAPTAVAPSRVFELRIGDEVEPIMAEYLDGGISASRARARQPDLDHHGHAGRPRGSSMQEIIQHILASPVPVVVYVSPTGSRGASAGFFILLSADVAAMAPGTHAGAASPLLAVGGVSFQCRRHAEEKNPQRRHRVPPQLFRKARPQRCAGRNGGHRWQSLHRNRSARPAS